MARQAQVKFAACMEGARPAILSLPAMKVGGSDADFRLFFS
jgi:hypothetical protein